MNGKPEIDFFQSSPDSIFYRVFKKERGLGLELALLKDIGLFLDKLLGSSYNINVGGEPAAGKRGDAQVN